MEAKQECCEKAVSEVVAKLRIGVLTILAQFHKEEQGNKLSQFSLIALRSMVENEFSKFVVVEKKMPS